MTTVGTVTWPRPVPLIGDATSAADRAGAPDAWAFPPEDRAALYGVLGARRDVRRYRPDPVPAELLERVLSAGHQAPSVGHSQPWRFLVVRDPAIREQAAWMADQERLSQAAQLEPHAARQLLDLQLEGIREAPLGIVVCCDRRVPAAGVLGRATFPDSDLWSCACAIQNLWLAARAEGLGLGWVTLFDQATLGELLRLPPDVVTLGWLCLGWPDERPPAPGLERAGWSQRQPLSEVVLTDRWSDTAAPVSRLRAPAPRWSLSNSREVTTASPCSCHTATLVSVDCAITSGSIPRTSMSSTTAMRWRRVWPRWRRTWRSWRASVWPNPTSPTPPCCNGGGRATLRAHGAC